VRCVPGSGDRGRRHLPDPQDALRAGNHCDHGIGGAMRSKDLTEADVRESLLQFDPLWDKFFSAEQARIVQLLIERIDVGTDNIDIKLRTDGIASLVREVAARSKTDTKEAA
jgi:hypothetical protein